MTNIILQRKLITILRNKLTVQVFLFPTRNRNEQLYFHVHQFVGLPVILADLAVKLNVGERSLTTVRVWKLKLPTRAINSADATELIAHCVQRPH